jgi:hypothetical protein
VSLERIALRAYGEPSAVTRRSPRRSRRISKPRRALLFDTETTVDAAQALLFGSYRYVRIGWQDNTPTLSTVEEGLIYADELPHEKAEGFAILQEYQASHPAALDPAYSHGLPVALKLYSRREFLKEMFYPAVHENRALVAGFNLPFDLSRLAVDWSAARKSFAGGFSLAVFEYEKDGVWHENRFKPRILVKSIDSKRALKGFAGTYSPDEIDTIPEGETEPEQGYIFRGNFLELRTLGFVLTDKGHTLASACKAFGVKHGKTKAKQHGVITPDYIDYNRRDVLATSELLEKTLAEYYRHPVDLRPTQAYSPASLGKAYLRTMGIAPVLSRQPDFRKDVLGYAMQAYFGGRADCRLRRLAVPVAYTDFTSMYPSVNALMDNWRLLTAKRIEVVDATREVKELLERVTIEDCFAPELWPQLRVLVKVRPCGQPLPTRARYDRRRAPVSAKAVKKERQGQSWQIGVNHLTSEQPLWFALPDLIGAKVLGGGVAEVLEALRLVSVGRQSGLSAVKLRGAIAVDPAKTDFFRTVIEERQRVRAKVKAEGRENDPLEGFLKVLANSTSYGVFAEFVRHELTGKRTERVTVWDTEGESFAAKTHAPEVPGEYCFPPLAAFITAAARLMLALLEARVAERGGSYVFCDTDSMAIVADEESRLIECPGGPHLTDEGKAAVLALSWDEVDEIREQFNRLNPYDRSAVPALVKIEGENFDKQGRRVPLHCYAISAKRYVLYYQDEQGGLSLPKASEHGLGHLLNPYDPDEGNRIEDGAAADGKGKPNWIKEAWRDILAKDVDASAGKTPSWWHEPALARITISSPAVLEPFEGMNKTRATYRERVKPFNFMLSARVDDIGYPVGVTDPQHFHLVTRYTRKPREALKASWFNRYDGKPYRVTIGSSADLAGQARILTYGEMLEDYRYRPEYKSTAPDGQTCGRETSGLLGRRSVEVLKFVYVGKESNRLVEANQGLLHDEEEALSEFDDPRHSDFVEFVLPVLATMSLSELVAATGLHASTLKRIRAGTARPHTENQDALWVVAIEHARAELTRRGLRLPETHLAALRLYIEAMSAQPRQCPVCGEPMAGRRQRYCTNRCRQRAVRARSRAN